MSVGLLVPRWNIILSEAEFRGVNPDEPQPRMGFGSVARASVPIRDRADP